MSDVTSTKNNEQSKEEGNKYEQLFGANYFVNPVRAGVTHLACKQIGRQRILNQSFLIFYHVGLFSIWKFSQDPRYKNKYTN